MTETKYLPKAMAVSNFLMKLSYRRGDDCPDSMPTQDFAYGEALEHWEKNGKDEADFFSTDDPWLLTFCVELEEEFGLEIIRHEVAEERHKISRVDYKVRGVNGFGGPFTWGIQPGEA